MSSAELQVETAGRKSCSGDYRASLGIGGALFWTVGRAHTAATRRPCGAGSGEVLAECNTSPAAGSAPAGGMTSSVRVSSGRALRSTLPGVRSFPERGEAVRHTAGIVKQNSMQLRHSHVSGDDGCRRHFQWKPPHTEIPRVRGDSFTVPSSWRSFMLRVRSARRLPLGVNLLSVCWCCELAEMCKRCVIQIVSRYVVLRSFTFRKLNSREW